MPYLKRKDPVSRILKEKIPYRVSRIVYPVSCIPYPVSRIPYPVSLVCILYPVSSIPYPVCVQYPLPCMYPVSLTLYVSCIPYLVFPCFTYTNLRKEFYSFVLLFFLFKGRKRYIQGLRDTGSFVLRYGIRVKLLQEWYKKIPGC